MHQEFLELQRKLRESPAELSICVIGLGYVGLPLAVEFSRHHKVIGFDVSTERIARLKSGEDPLGIHTPADIKRVRYCADTNEVPRCDVFIVAVPTDIDDAKQPDLHPFKRAAAVVCDLIHLGGCVIVESTVYPGCTEEVFVPIVERSGLKRSQDFWYGFSPERIVPGRPLKEKGDLHGSEHTLTNTMKVVSGCCEDSLQFIAQLYTRIITAGVHRARTVAIAEAAKILENTQRDLNIALMNEFALICHRIGVDTQEVIDAAATKWNFLPFRPGLVGGHCHPPEERVTVRGAAGIQRLTVKEVYERREKLEILSWVDGAPAFMPLVEVRKREYSKGIRFTLGSGRIVVVTDGHPMMVQVGTELQERSACQVAVGDRFPVVLGFPEVPQPEMRRVDLLDLARGAPERFRVRPRKGSVAGSWGDLRLSKREFPGAQNFRAGNYLPLAAFLELEAHGRSPWQREELLVCSGRGNGYSQVPAVLELKEDFARLLGYYVAEGCVTLTDATTTTRWSFNVKETPEIADLHGILRSYGIPFSTWEDKACHTLHTKVSGVLFGELISGVLGAGRRSEDVEIPQWLRWGSNVYTVEFLKGLFRGDGWARAAGGHGASVGFFSVNPVLRDQVGVALRALGIRYSLNDHGWIVLSGDAARRLSKEGWFLGEKAKALGEAKISSRASRVWQPFAAGMPTVPVKSVEPVELQEVYSLEVGISHLVVVGDGVLVHNCIGVDPYYLAYQAQRHNFHPQVILAGRQINDRMGVYVGRKTAQMVTATGRTAAPVLVLGAAFKENCDDLRNSRVVEIVSEIRAYGLEVVVVDELVDQGHLERVYGEFQSLSSKDARAGEWGAVVLAVPHQVFLESPWTEFLAGHLKAGGILVDVKGAYRNSAIMHLAQPGRAWHL